MEYQRNHDSFVNNGNQDVYQRDLSGYMHKDTNEEKNNVNVGNDERFGFFNNDRFISDA